MHFRHKQNCAIAAKGRMSCFSLNFKNSIASFQSFISVTDFLGYFSFTFLAEMHQRSLFRGGPTMRFHLYGFFKLFFLLFSLPQPQQKKNGIQFNSQNNINFKIILRSLRVRIDGTKENRAMI